LQAKTQLKLLTSLYRPSWGGVYLW